MQIPDEHNPALKEPEEVEEEKSSHFQGRVTDQYLKEDKMKHKEDGKKDKKDVNALKNKFI